MGEEIEEIRCYFCAHMGRGKKTQRMQLQHRVLKQVY